MGKIVINKERCKGCTLCITFCPKGFIKADKKLNKKGVKPAKFEENPECPGCSMCAIVCPECCIEVFK